MMMWPPHHSSPCKAWARKTSFEPKDRGNTRTDRHQVKQEEANQFLKTENALLREHFAYDETIAAIQQCPNSRFRDKGLYPPHRLRLCFQNELNCAFVEARGL